MDSKCWGFVRNMQNSQVGFPGGASGKEPTCSAGDLRWGFDPWVRKISWRKNWQPTPVFLPGEPHGQRSLVGYSPWGSQRVRQNWSDWPQQHPSLVLNCLCCLFLALSDKSIPYPIMPPPRTIIQQFSEHENISHCPLDSMGFFWERTLKTKKLPSLVDGLVVFALFCWWLVTCS